MAAKFSDVHLLKPWRPMPSVGHGNHVAELHRELCAGHALFGADVVAIAMRGDCDDVLFAVRDRKFQYAVVHLTWSGQPEGNPFPTVESYATCEDWLERGMKRDHENWQRGGE